MHFIQLTYRHAPISSAPISGMYTTSWHSFHDIHSAHTQHQIGTAINELQFSHISHTANCSAHGLQALVLYQIRLQAELNLCSAYSAEDKETLEPQLITLRFQLQVLMNPITSTSPAAPPPPGVQNPLSPLFR